MEVEFEDVYQIILWSNKSLGQREKLNLKSKFLDCFKYLGKIKTPYEYSEVVKNQSKNKDICLLKQDKGRGIIIKDRTKYVEKCLIILESEKSEVVLEDPTA